MGLFDNLYGGGQQYGNLVDDSAREEAKRRALLAITSQLLQAGGPSRLPVSTGQAIGGALQAGQGASDEAYQQAIKAAMLGREMKDRELRTQMAGMPTPNGQRTHVVNGALVDDTGKVIYKGESERAQDPSAVAEHKYFMSLSPAKQQEYLTVKRAQQSFMTNVAGSPTIAQAPQFPGQAPKVMPISTAQAENDAAAAKARAEAGARETGQRTAAAAADLPTVERGVTDAVSLIKQLKTHPGLGYITGISSVAPVVPGTPQADATALADQLKGKVFLQAYQSLKGGGAITEVEGKKAEEAIAALQRYQSKESYIQNLNKLEQVLNNGLELAKKKANSPSSSNVIDFGDLP